MKRKYPKKKTDIFLSKGATFLSKGCRVLIRSFISFMLFSSYLRIYINVLVGINKIIKINENRIRENYKRNRKNKK